ncbi:cytochrome o ubiquinol oxidase subunit III [Salinisphaera aquimarina]|uniref:Cytochrome bo(3) ubiquinol oxidase subunit 3 n=1 Tax=Salinisphaera aquimarina TaxID=2094031 RepID=A0ABV7EQL5_9GAMM
MSTETVGYDADIKHDAEISSASRADTEVNFGFWIYLMSDVILFSMLFVAYIDLSDRTAGGPIAAEIFELPLVFAETMALLISSLTFGLAMLAMHAGNRQRVMMWLGVTFVLGLSFISMELYEFTHLIADGAGPQRSAFLSAFFSLVGTHGLHVTAGLIWIAVMAGQVATKGLNAHVVSRMARLSLFWHFLDLVWIAVFSTVYLAGVMQ